LAVVTEHLAEVPTGSPKDAAKEHSAGASAETPKVEAKVRLDAVPTGLPKDAARQTVWELSAADYSDLLGLARYLTEPLREM